MADPGEAEHPPKADSLSALSRWELADAFVEALKSARRVRGLKNEQLAWLRTPRLQAIFLEFERRALNELAERVDERGHESAAEL